MTLNSTSLLLFHREVLPHYKRFYEIELNGGYRALSRTFLATQKHFASTFSRLFVSKINVLFFGNAFVPAAVWSRRNSALHPPCVLKVV